ncbi:hypothetical protein EPO05_02950 [Patescibacteria group bacterium]|nr:MAG: hypothetical protein EPO05_02950 [Patescibacteria group bacterium]
MRKQILIFGASTEWGSWDIEAGGWPERLKLFLFQREHGSVSREYDFHNLSICGNKSSDVLRRFKFEAGQRANSKYFDTTVIIFAVGTNDAVYSKNNKGCRTKLADFEKNLGKLISEAKKYSQHIFYKGLMRVDEKLTTPVDWNDDAFIYNEYLEKYNNAIMKVCADKKVGYIDMGGLMKKGDLYDGLHPNAKGHEKIYRKIKAQLLRDNLI